ncbi:MAG: flagellar protein FlgN [Gammaproteobacteria bacterium]|nr:flagellar protein FlgN [Gammaproteobacteria bacterium]
MTVCQLCDQWVEQLQTFLLTLESEFDTLKSNQAEAITSITELKSRQLDEIIQTEDSLKALLPKDTNINQIVDYLSQHCTSSAASSRLLTLTKSIQQANQRNAMLLQSLMRLNEFGLNLLSGKIEIGNTYGSSGKVKTGTPISSLTLARA